MHGTGDGRRRRRLRSPGPRNSRRMRRLLSWRPNSPKALLMKYALESGLRNAMRARKRVSRRHACAGRPAMATRSNSRQPISDLSKQYRMAARGMPSTKRARVSLPSSIAATILPPARSAAAESWAMPEMPSMCMSAVSYHHQGDVTNELRGYRRQGEILRLRSALAVCAGKARNAELRSG